jgi:hypothetical protein
MLDVAPARAQDGDADVGLGVPEVVAAADADGVARVL